MDYADVVETACKTGPDSLVKYSNFARYKLKIISTFKTCLYKILNIIDRKLINLFLCITQVVNNYSKN